ncbi:MAG TPA: alanine--tRNA ligase [Candidatus Dormibacteraeota bacterium]|nr:alanine--tRNA ligase [Candidatus Dormibacteraeota bacterium]
MTGADVRSSFLDFFRARGHEIVRSSSIVPSNDPTLLFTNAGMVQFKNVFLGQEHRDNPRAASAQKCLRLSGKHNDLEEVGRDTYHHTLFEMLGNWSFGEYYKKEAILWAWELLTEVWKLPKDKLWATVFRTDDEAESLWKGGTDINPAQVLRFDETDNFWEMGDTGPCGPCSEIHIDRGPDACDKQHVAGHQCAVNVGCSRYIELWNLVFIQYDRQPGGELAELKSKHVDTGMGLERVTAVLQHVASNYDTDLFRRLIAFVEERSGRRYGADEESDLAMRVIADHSRALNCMIADGVVPSNEGRGYVLRRILRRAARHARVLGFEQPFLYAMSEPVCAVLGGAYPELVERRAYIEEVVRSEEERFAETLDRGLDLLTGEREALQRKKETVLPGDVAFKLYDTYGFPVDMTEDILRDHGITVDQAGFKAAMAAQRQRARDARKAAGEGHIVGSSASSRFVGDRVYEHESPIAALSVDGDERDEVRTGESVHVVAAETPFYGESGGQVGDRGVIETADGALVEITDTLKPRADLTVHVGTVVRGAVRTGQTARLVVDRERREATRLNHSVTHILHGVLRSVLGDHVRQAGSLVAPDRLRFDFTQPTAIDEAALARIEEEVNAHIRENAEVTVEEMAYDAAIKAGALAFFGDKYGDRVRVVRMGDFSTELCGGTHVRRTGDIGLFKLRGEAGVAAGTRRIEAITGVGALEWVRASEQSLRRVGELLRGGEDDVAARVERLLAQQKQLERQLQQLQRQVAGSQSGDLLSQAQTIKGRKVIAARIEESDPKRMLEIADQLRERLGSGIVVLAGAHDGQVRLLAAVTKDLAGQVHAGKLVGEIAPLVGGRGGGRPELAQAGGSDASQIDAALARAIELVS